MSRQRRGGFARGVYSIISVFLVLGTLVGGGVFFFAMQQFEQPGPLDSAAVVDIRSGVGLAKIAETLEAQGIIDDQYVFMGGVFLNNEMNRLKAGEFAIPARASMRDVMTILVEGKALLYKVTIPEGLTTYEILQKIAADPVLEGELTLEPAEGTMLPETYSFPRGTTRDQVIMHMQRAQDRLFEELWDKRAPNLPFDTREEALTLASIVEKETGMPEERPQVASVFVNRLRRSMRLQSDPTIIYGVTGGRHALGRPILRSEIDSATPYNTYQIDGLPPTPIANPGRASIEATLNPAETSYLYFVADGTGGHVFAESLAEHTRNVARWRQIERQRAQEAAEARNDSVEAGGGGATVETETEDLPLLNQ